jgi:hypothetical protein
MNKKDAIKKVEEFLKTKKFNWEAIYQVDNEPIENHQYWIFRNLWEPRESIRGNRTNVDGNYPKIVVDKEKGIVKEISNSEFSKLDI